MKRLCYCFVELQLPRLLAIDRSLQQCRKGLCNSGVVSDKPAIEVSEAKELLDVPKGLRL